jgi:hypothetical protein
VGGGWEGARREREERVGKDGGERKQEAKSEGAMERT